MRAEPLLIVVSGAPGTGKTTLARRVAGEFGLPLISRDSIKETLFDTLGWSDREWSKRLGLASIELLFKLIEVQLEARKTLVAESNFYGHLDGPRFDDLRDRYEFELLELHCITPDLETLIARYEARMASGQRHPGHVELPGHRELKRGLAEGTWEPVTNGGRLVRVDTTDLAAIDYERLFGAVRAALGGPG